MPAGSEFRKQPPQDVLKEIYGKCDAWLFSSRSEGFGLPLLEAMACRTPVIATPAGAAPDLCAGGGGILVPRDDPAAMARAIERVAGMPESAWQELSEKAHQTASRYTWDDAVSKFEAALRLAVERTRRGDFVPAPAAPTPATAS
jgi:glycosyltransferase involved in cell wall biosynthesis